MIGTKAARMRREVAALEAMSYPALKARYEDLTGGSPPKRIGRALLKLAVAYEIQRKGNGALVERIHKKLAKAAVTDEAAIAAKTPKRRIKPGGRLVREWRGQSYEVYVAEDGVYMDGTRHKSLSSAAFAITGAKWNGPRFFGLRSSRNNAQAAT